MIVAYSPTPFADQWGAFNELSTGVPWFSLKWLWRQHSEHRVPLLQLATITDLKLFGGHSVLLFFLTYFTFVLHWGSWSLFLKKTTSIPTFVWYGIAGFFAFCIFCPNQGENLYWAIQLTFVASFCFASLSFISLTWFSTRGSGWTAIVVASVFALASESSLAGGTFSWLILWLASVKLPLRRRQRLALLFAGVACLVAYFYDYKTPAAHSNPLVSIRQPGRLFKYLLIYFGHSLSFFVTYPGVVSVVLSLFAFAALVFLLRRGRTRVAATALTMTMCFVIGVGVLTALGRLKFGVDQAVASRYQTSVMLYWACAYAALVIAAAELSAWRDVFVLNLLALACIVLPAGKLPSLADSMKQRANLMSSVGESLDQSVFDPQAQAALVASMTAVEPATIYLHNHGYRIVPPPKLTPESLRPSEGSSHLCFGWVDSWVELTRFFAGPRTYRVGGWAVDSQSMTPASRIVLEDGNGRVLAATEQHLARPDVLAAHPGASGLVGWYLYAPIRSGAGPLRAFAIVQDKPCPLQNALPVSTP
jgi:hypothetical protein